MIMLFNSDMHSGITIMVILYLQCALRPVSVVVPDYVCISEALLLSYGFTEAATLSWSLAQALDCLKCQVHSLYRRILESKFYGLSCIIMHIYSEIKGIVSQ